MLRVIALSLLIATPALADVPPSPPGPAQVVVTFEAPPGMVTCSGNRDLKVVEAASLHPRLAPARPISDPIVVSTDHAPIPNSNADGIETLSFSVDADGRPLDIRRAPASRGDIDFGATIAALAAWRFEAGAPASGCRASIVSHRIPLAEASRATLFEIIAFERRSAPVLVRETVSKAGDCGIGPHRQPKTIGYPDLRRFNDRDLNPAWAAAVYDIDAGGTPRNVRIEVQGGDPALADVAASAIAESRFQPGRPVKACYGTFAATPRDTPAPPRPDIASFERPGDKCDVAKEALNLPAFKNYPRPYAARKVAGWAYLRFDVAPWGQIGNIQVLASQPSAAFGDAAQSLLWSAKPKAPPEGYRGCLVPVIYAIPDPEPILD
jgi:TonB family protein